jgi:hypothetical protein
VIRLEGLRLQRIAGEVLEQLGVSGSADVTAVAELLDGTWMVGFEDRAPHTRFPVFEIAIQSDWTPEQAARELRLELRDKLWICPLCQRRSQIRRLVDRELFRVECDRCGRFEIEQALLDHFRSAYEAADSQVLERLARLSDGVRRRGSTQTLSVDNWQAIADEAAR